MNTAWLCVAVLGCFVMTTDAAVTAWTVPVISAMDGTGTVATALAENAPTFPQLAATGATAYAITSQTPDGIFQITAGDGQLALVASKVLDYETAKKHVLVVTASDGASSTGTATITINISDANDNPPVFPMSTYSACVVDKAMAGTTVLTLSAPTDVDTTTTANVISAVSIADGNTNTDFAIATSRVITLANAVDMDTTAGYALRVEAVDSDPTTKLTGTTTVYVIVAEKCGGCESGVGILAASLMTLLVALVTSFSLL